NQCPAGTIGSTKEIWQISCPLKAALAFAAAYANRKLWNEIKSLEIIVFKISTIPSEFLIGPGNIDHNTPIVGREKHESPPISQIDLSARMGHSTPIGIISTAKVWASAIRWCLHTTSH